MAVGHTNRGVGKMDLDRLIQKAFSNGPAKDGKILCGSDQRNFTLTRFTRCEEVRWLDWPKGASADKARRGHRIWKSQPDAISSVGYQIAVMKNAVRAGIDALDCSPSTRCLVLAECYLVTVRGEKRDAWSRTCALAAAVVIEQGRTERS